MKGRKMHASRRLLPPLAALLLLLTCWNLAAAPASVAPDESATPETPFPSEETVPPPATEAAAESSFADEIILGLLPEVDESAVAPCLEAVQGTVASRLEELRALVVRLPVGTQEMALARLQACPGVDYAEPNGTVTIADVIPNDPYYASDQWGLPVIRAPQGWAYTTGSSAVIIAIVDTGIDLGHPDLAAKLVAGRNIINPAIPPNDDNGHGTHVAGIAAASSNNGLGVAGVSWGARLMPVKVLNSGGSGTFAHLAAGIQWAADNGAHIINLSVGSVNPSNLVENAIAYAHAADVVVVAAAGNTWGGSVLYPARYDHVIAVSATAPGDVLAPFSAVGPEIDLAAPGDDILSTSPGGTYLPRDGTSQAAAYVSGLAAILRGMPGCGSADNIEWLMEANARDLGPLGPDAMFGAGLIQMDAAILSLYQPPTPTAFPAATATPAYAGPPLRPSLTATRPSPPAAATASLEASPTLTATFTVTPPQPAAGGIDETPPPSPIPPGHRPPHVESPLLLCYGSGLLLTGVLFLILAVRQRKGKIPRRIHK
jgi:thermitase